MYITAADKKMQEWGARARNSQKRRRSVRDSPITRFRGEIDRKHRPVRCPPQGQLPARRFLPVPLGPLAFLQTYGGFLGLVVLSLAIDRFCFFFFLKTSFLGAPPFDFRLVEPISCPKVFKASASSLISAISLNSAFA